MIPKRLTAYSFPPYSYVTGLSPHPLRDPAGHGCPGPDETEQPPSAEDWQACEAYLWGIDLFNAGFYWEAHESWEAVWHAAGRRGAVADWCKGLIKLAAAGVKAREGRVDGVRRHAVRALELFSAVRAEVAEEPFMGLSVADVSRQAIALEGDAEEVVAQSMADSKRATLAPLTLVEWPKP